MLKWTVRAFAAAILGLGLAALGVLAWRAAALRQTAAAIAISTPAGIDEERFVRINGLDQWITIRGQNRSNPIVLVLHGGPGSPESYLLKAFLPMERDHVVVQWDQRGGGKTLARAGGLVDPHIDMATLVNDGLAVADYARRRLGQPRVVIVGHSWGSILGVKMLQARPDLFSAYVGTGLGFRTLHEWQGWIYKTIRAKAAATRNTKSLAELAKIEHPPPWADDAPEMTHMAVAMAPFMPPNIGYVGNAVAALSAPHWTIRDVQTLPKGMEGMLHARVWDSTVRDRYVDGPFVFHVPVVVIQGSEDLVAPDIFARRWFDSPQAPAKVYVVIPGQGHELLSYDNAAFTRALDGALRPLLTPSTP